MTSNYDAPVATVIADQATVLVALAGLAVSHPQLPGAYFAISDVTPGELPVQLDSLGKLEAWREALNVPTDQVVLRKCGDRMQVRFEATAYGVLFRAHAIYDPIEQGGEVAPDAVPVP